MGKFPKGAIGEDLAIIMSSDRLLDNGDICKYGWWSINRLGS
jgi:hypothetical protein